MSVLNIPTAEVFLPLVPPARDKGAYGGRGSGKSHFFAGLMIEDCLAEPGDSGEGLRGVCIREMQKDLAQSAKRLIEAKLGAFGLGEADGFKVYRDQIRTPGDGVLIFKGMNDYTADSIKSLEGFKRAWWEEAQGATARSIGLLRPTLRAGGSQMWWSWNPRRKLDPVVVVGVTPTILHQSAPRRSVDSVLLLSDSMFGVPNVQGQMAPLVAPRMVNLITRGGGTSRNVMSTYEWYVATQGDPYKGEFTFIWQGQNNQPVTVGDVNWCQVTEAALELRNLLGARDRRFCFLSILGIDQMTFDGTRIHVTQHEAMFAGAAQNHVLWQLEQWYAAMFPGQWISPRLALLAAAAGSAILDARYPGSGMTEAQTAAAYGWVPYSYWNPPAGGWPIPLGSLSLQGYWSSSSLPAGGTNGQAYTISGGALGNVGNLIINVAGTWGVYAADQTHQGSGANQGGQYLAAALANFLSSNSL